MYRNLRTKLSIFILYHLINEENLEEFSLQNIKLNQLIFQEHLFCIRLLKYTQSQHNTFTIVNQLNCLEQKFQAGFFFNLATETFKNKISYQTPINKICKRRALLWVVDGAFKV